MVQLDETEVYEETYDLNHFQAETRSKSKDPEGSLVNQASYLICEDCARPISIKTEQNQNQIIKKHIPILCEKHHLKRLGLLCPSCSKPTTPEEPVHRECISCPDCTTTTHSSHYDFKGQSYCRAHYSLLKETQCGGCEQTVLKQFVEHPDDTIWHPECYMIEKFWGVKLKSSRIPDVALVEKQSALEHKITRVWSDLSLFEESSANCISDMLLNVAAGAYSEGVRMANQFIMHLEILFKSLSFIQSRLPKTLIVKSELDCTSNAKLVCRQVVQFFQLLTATTKPDKRVTQKLLSLVTSLAQQLKSLIRWGLCTSLRLENDFEIKDCVLQFLQPFSELDKKRVWIAGRYWFKDPPKPETDICTECKLLIHDTECYRYERSKRWHPKCFRCCSCSILLNHNTARITLPSFWLYCLSCCPGDSVIELCSYVTILEQYLNSLKMSMSRKSEDMDMKVSSQHFQPNLYHSITEKPITRRRNSFLNMFATKTKSKNSGTVHLSEFQGNISSSRAERTQLPLSINTSRSISTSSRTPPQAPLSSIVTTGTTTETTTTSSPKSPKLNSLRRAFSANQNSTFYKVFDKNRKKQVVKRASVFDPTNATSSNDNRYLPTLDYFQDYVLRHAAVVSIHSLASYYSIDSILALLEENNNNNNKNYNSINFNVSNSSSTSLWGKIKVHMKETVHNSFSPSSPSSHFSSSLVKTSKVFGVPIMDLANREKHAKYKGIELPSILLASSPLSLSSLSSCYSENSMVPIFVRSCVAALMQSDVSKEGIFRKNGNIRQLRELADQIDKDVQTDLSEQTTIQLAALLKRYLRELPEPLLTFRLYDLFTITSVNNNNNNNREKLVHLACCLLPKANRDTMLLVFGCLKWISSFSNANKMDIANLARVIAPSVLFSKGNADPKKGAQSEIEVVEYLIQNSDELTMIPNDLVLLQMEDFQQQENLNSRSFIEQYIKLLQARNKMPVNNSISLPTSPKSPTTPNTILITKPSVKSRRSSWIPGRR